ncbi:hypothetical protein RJT34_07256 [Clitoria ternatea]|uniref:Uncharacterized protein n=1 Tax=Clitoria ternatea TaxID=43366 RepID=A0AAN9K552_CLITE
MSDEDDGENSVGSDQDRAYKLLGKAKEKIMEVLEEEDEVPKSGLLSLPFMAEKLHTKALPFPFTSKEVFEQSMCVPIGPEFNPATAIGALNRLEVGYGLWPLFEVSYFYVQVVKRPGVIIKPIEFEDVNPYEKQEQQSGEK